MPDYQPIDYRLRCHTKRTDLPVDVLRDIGEAYAEIERLRNERNAFEAERDELIRISNKLKYERDEARREILESLHPDDRRAYGEARGWDCFNTPEAKIDRTLNGVIVDGGKAIPPKYEDLGDE